MTNVQKLSQIFEWVKSLFEAVFKGGDSMLYKESLQYQIDRAGERTWHKPLIKGWTRADGSKYDTSPAQQLVYLTQALARVEASQKASESLLAQIADAANKGVAVNIDYDRIKSMMPTYELVPTEGAK